MSRHVKIRGAEMLYRRVIPQIRGRRVNTASNGPGRLLDLLMERPRLSNDRVLATLRRRPLARRLRE